MNNNTSKINAQVLADASYLIKNYRSFDSTLKYTKELVKSVITNDNISAEVSSGTYTNVYGKSAESCFFAHENHCSKSWNEEQIKTKVELVKTLCYVNSKCREIIYYMHNRLHNLERIPDEMKTDIERKTIKELRSILNKYDFNNPRTLNFINVFLNEETVVDVAEEISDVFKF